MQVLVIETDQNRYYARREDGALCQAKYFNTAYGFSGQWLLRGARATGPFNSVAASIPTRALLDSAEPAAALDRLAPLRFKNGKGRWHIRDLDHGTMREWGETIRHVYWRDVN